VTDARPTSRLRDLAILGAIALLGFALRVVAVLQYQGAHPNAAAPVIDEASYDRWARAIAAGEWMGSEVFFQEPLYPYALASLYAVAGPSLLAARIAQCALWAVTIVLVGLLARRTFGRAAGFVAAAALALYGPGLLFPCLLLKENLFLPVLAAMLLFLVGTRAASGGKAIAGWLGVGLLAGLAALLRGNVLVLLPVLAAWPIVRRLMQRARLAPGLRDAALVALGAACALVPVAWRNWHVGGVFVLTTSGAGTNVYGGNNAENPYGRATEFSFVRGIPEHEAGDWAREAARRTGRELDPQEVSSFWLSETLRSARERPLAHAAILWNKLRLSLGAYEVPDNHMLGWDARFVPIARLPWPGFGVVGALGVAGILAWTALRLARRTPVVTCAGGADELAIFCALYLGTIVLTVTSDRARLPLIIVLAPFAAWLVVQAVAWMRARQRAPLGVAAGALAVALVLAHVSVLSAADRAEDWDERDHNLAVQWIDDEQHAAEGRRLAEELAVKHPRTARVRLLLATYDQRRAARLLSEPSETAREAGRAQLLDVLRRACEIADEPRVFPRERFRSNSLAAWVAFDLGESEEALARFATARTFDPDAMDLRAGEARAGIAAAVTQFEAGRAQVEAGDKERPLGEVRVENALDRLQVIALDRALPAAERARARAAAGWIQLWLGRLPNAERHFRAARELFDSDDAALGLAQTLVARAEALQKGPERAALVEEAARLALALPDPMRSETGLTERLQRLRE